MSTVLIIIELVSALLSAYQAAESDGTAADVQKALGDLMGEFVKPSAQDAIADVKEVFKVK